MDAEKTDTDAAIDGVRARGLAIGTTWRSPADPNNYAFIGANRLIVMTEGRYYIMERDPTAPSSPIPKVSGT